MDFNFHETLIENYLTGRKYKLISMAQIDVSDDFLNSVVRICNEQKVYDWLFRDKLLGKPYPRAMAENFKKWGNDGWKSNTHFLFIVLSEQGDLAAACDIKTSNLAEAEIGYWASSRHCGVITNAIKAMVGAGFKAGYECFFARVKQDNSDSAAVLVRAGFSQTFDTNELGFNFFRLRSAIK